MIYRAPIFENGEQIYPAHIEFYIGNNKIISWGKVHKEYFISKEFVARSNNGLNGFYSNSIEDKNSPYICLIRFKGA